MKTLVLGISIILFIVGCADLRTKESKKNPNTQKALQLLKQMGAAHHIEEWANINTYTVQFEDEFFGKLGNPYPDPNTAFEIDYIPGSFDGYLTFTSGAWAKKNYGIQSWHTYHRNEAGEAVFKKNKDAYFWVPTYQYFIEFPLRIQEATAVSYAGERMIDGKLCDGVLASWGKLKPQKNTDQYLLWIERETKLIYKLEYTIREALSFIKGAAYFKNYQSYNGLMLPSNFPVESSLVKDGLLHEMRIKGFETNKVETSTLRPNKNIVTSGDQKP